MKAITQAAYGPPHEVLELADVDDPEMTDGEVLIDVHAASINAADWYMVRGEPLVARADMGLRAPKARIPGCDVAGRIAAVGSGVTTVSPDDEVIACTYGVGYGAFAERVSVPASVVALKPANLSFEEAAAIPLAASTALQAVRDHGQVEAGQQVLVIGASGGVGSFAVQIAKALGAEVTGVASSAKLDLVRSLGADHVLDYTETDPSDGSRRYDLVLQAGGTASAKDCRPALNPDGRLVMLSGDGGNRWTGPLGRLVGLKLLSPFVGQEMINFLVKPNTAALEYLTDFVETGRLTPVVDRTFPLPDVPAAIRRLEAGHARGKVVVTVSNAA